MEVTMPLTDLMPALDALDNKETIKAIQFLASKLETADVSSAPEYENGLQLSQTEDDDVATKNALAFYRNHLQAQLEPARNGDNVAIHPDSGTYEIARGSGHAYRALRAKQPMGLIVVHKIGPDSGLAARMRGEHPR
jgi:hypothetical protein